mgnify:CR=1 FL=1
MGNVFKALSDPNRRAMLNLLKVSDLSAGEITSHFNMTAPSISHHLSILHEAELVQRQKKGQQVIYTINTTVLQDVMNWIIALQQEES